MADKLPRQDYNISYSFHQHSHLHSNTSTFTLTQQQIICIIYLALPLPAPQLYLCIGGAYYEPYSCLLISNKFCFVGGAARAGRTSSFMHLLLHPPQLFALKPPSWALVHKTTYEPMVYTALWIMFWMPAFPLLGQVGGGWALEFLSFWAPNGTRLSARCHFTSPKKTFEFQRPTPSHLPS
jgi:hypothetical protein